MRLLSLLWGLSAIAVGSCRQDKRAASATKHGRVKINFTAGVDTTAAAPLPKTLGALSIEFCYILDYLGDVDSTNTLTYKLLHNIQALTGVPPLIRIGGHTQDVAQYHPGAKETINNVFDPGNLEAVNVTFNDGLYKVLNSNVPSKQQFVFGLNFGQDHVAYPLAELSGAERHVEPGRIVSYELGNEPDFYNVQRPSGWNVGVYTTQQERWIRLLKARISHPEHGWQLGAFAQEPIYMGNFSLAGITQLGLPRAVGNVKTLSDHTYPFSICDGEIPFHTEYVDAR